MSRHEYLNLDAEGQQPEGAVFIAQPNGAAVDLVGRPDDAKRFEEQELLVGPERSDRPVSKKQSNEEFPRYIVIGNRVYTIWACSVFALLSFFRAHGKNNFTDVTPMEAGVGLFYAACSIAVNVPMSLLFFYKTVKTGRTVYLSFFRLLIDRFGEDFLRDSPDFLRRVKDPKNTDYYLLASFITALPLGGLTTAAGAALSNSSLNGWLPDGPAEWFFGVPTVFIFSINTLTTRTMSSVNLLNSLLRSVAEQVAKRIVYKKSEEYQSLFTVLDDLDRFGSEVGLLEADGVDKTNIDACLPDLIRNFYSKLEGKSPEYTIKEIAGKALKFLSEATLVTLALDSLALWLGLSEQGLNLMGSGGQYPGLVWAAALSHLSLYANSARLAPSEMISVARQFSKMPPKKIIGFLGMLGLLGVAAWFSGAGYTQTASTMVNNKSFGDTATSLLNSDNGLARAYQGIYYQFLGEGFFSNWLFFLMSGLVVNGKWALSGILDEANTFGCIKRQFPEMFSHPNTVHCSVVRDYIIEEILHFGDESMDPLVDNAIKEARRNWIMGENSPKDVVLDRGSSFGSLEA